MWRNCEEFEPFVSDIWEMADDTRLMSDDIGSMSCDIVRVSHGIRALSSDIAHVSYDIAQMPAKFLGCLNRFVLREFNLEVQQNVL
jgi:hypothetical protein